MIHNKHFEILEKFIGNLNREIYGRELIGKVDLSQKGIALALKELEKEGVLKSRKSGNIKFYSLNLKYSQIKEVVMVTEVIKKMRFCLENPKIAHVFENDDRIVGVFGSYAKGNQKEGSDIDVLIVGEKRKEDYARKGEKFNLDISTHYFTEREFRKLLQEKNKLLKEIVAYHILIFNVEKFIQIIWGDYYGFD